VSSSDGATAVRCVKPHLIYHYAFDDRVERALYQRAIGWGNLPPDVTACIYWLKNRRKDRWRDVQQVEASLGHYVISERPLTEDEWQLAQMTAAHAEAEAHLAKLTVDEASVKKVVRDTPM
jgi:hypothetical protein